MRKSRIVLSLVAALLVLSGCETLIGLIDVADDEQIVSDGIGTSPVGPDAAVTPAE